MLCQVSYKTSFILAARQCVANESSQVEIANKELENPPLSPANDFFFYCRALWYESARYNEEGPPLYGSKRRNFYENVS
ncbi:hypothetical protein GWI33_019498 [Rhynchophorus ferrugineus]|uniref:Uncharacterized protein n=1 Tax=Rhynchophorus ferrugineus TaxID=354439 RepID=A0A834HY81_RHYFE|nr:hypothetical protein GWI33_019498 [Rhynchophorus ferrugineus]